MWDEVAEWLRRWTANPVGSPRVGSNPILLENFYFLFTQICSAVNDTFVQQLPSHIFSENWNDFPCASEVSGTETESNEFSLILTLADPGFGQGGAPEICSQILSM